MTARFERHCGKVTIVPQREGFIGVDSLGEELTQLPDCERFWLREVLLCGDNVPWLFGRTLIPETSLTGKRPLAHARYGSSGSLFVQGRRADA